MHQLAGAGTALRTSGAHYEEHLRVPAMSVGTYTVRAGQRDPQQPHREDEIYVVVSGRASLWTPQHVVDVSAGAVLFVPAGEEHRFEDVVDDLTVLVVFAPAES